jgi:hypothetical protein
MKLAILNHASPEILEARRIAEIKALSYEERLERLFVIMEVSYMMRVAYENQKKIDERANN